MEAMGSSDGHPSEPRSPDALTASVLAISTKQKEISHMFIEFEKRCRLFGGPLPRALAAVALVSVLPLTTSAQPSPGVFGPGPGCNLFPAPASVGATVNLSYFGPPPSENNPSFVGPVQLLKSGQVDVAKGTVTLPLYH